MNDQKRRQRFLIDAAERLVLERARATKVPAKVILRDVAASRDDLPTAEKAEADRMVSLLQQRLARRDRGLE